MAKEIELKQS
jgi:hypothetical protein